MRRGKIPLQSFFQEKIKFPHSTEEVENDVIFDKKNKI